MKLNSPIQKCPRYEQSQENNNSINLLKTKGRPLYLKTQSVPRCKHLSPRL